MQKVDLSKLEMAALWRYWRHFNLVGLILPTFRPVFFGYSLCKDAYAV